MKIKILSGIILTGLLIAISGQASASSCASMKKKMESVFGINTKEVCASLDTEPSLENIPFLYISPDAGCPHGLQLPGLPDFGISLGSLDACAIVQAVTGPIVREANQQMRDVVKEGTDLIDSQIDDVMNNIPEDATKYINDGKDIITVTP